MVEQIILFIIAVATFVILFVMFAKSYIAFEGRKSRNAELSNKTTRAAESVILFCAATTIFLFVISKLGYFQKLNQLQTGFAILFFIPAVIAFAGILICSAVVFYKSTFSGLMLSAVVLVGYIFLLIFASDKMSSHSSSTIKPGDGLIITLGSPDAQGGELWVNGVHLGTLPYETTFKEFFEKVPYWPKEPDENKNSLLLVPDQWSLYSNRPIGALFRPWAQMMVSRKLAEVSDINEIRNPENDLAYYVRVKLNGEWGYSDGSINGIRGVSQNFYKRKSIVTFNFIFPERQKKINDLLDIARLYDYSPKSEWFAAMSTYRSDGWKAVRKEIDTEPDMSKLLDAWATWKFGLDSVTDTKSAWDAFKRVCAYANKQDYYITSDVTGRAIELLLPRLDSKQLVKEAVKLASSIKSFSGWTWEQNGKLQFGMTQSGVSINLGAKEISTFGLKKSENFFLPGDYAVAHAVWKLDELLDEKEGAKPNIVESELVPVLTALNYDNLYSLEIISRIGGPYIEQYLLNQKWQIDAEELPNSQILSFRLKKVNRWLYLLANLKGPTGEQFRQKNADIIMNMADVITDSLFVSLKNELDFLFIDNQLGEKSLAFKYWPRFKARMEKERKSSVEYFYPYLIKMEPASTVEMYVQCCKENNSVFIVFEQPFSKFRNVEIPRSKRKQIYEALVEQVNRDSINTNFHNDREEQLRKSWLSQIKGFILPTQNSERAEEIFNGLESDDPKYKPENISMWLTIKENSNPLINMLAKADRPEFRLLVMGALQENPTPANREILKKLLSDNDEQVRSAAKQVASKLEQFKETAPEKFAARVDIIQNENKN